MKRAKFRPLSFSPPGLVLGLAGLMAGGLLSAQAATDTWVGNTDANWGTSGNWTFSSGSGPVASGDSLVFGVAGSSGLTLNNNLSGLSFANLTFNSGASAFTVKGNSFTLGNNGTIANNSSVNQTISNSITLNGGTVGISLTGTSPLTFGGAVNESGSKGTRINNGTVIVTGSFEDDSGDAVIGNTSGNAVVQINGGLFKSTAYTWRNNTWDKNWNVGNVSGAAGFLQMSSGNLSMGRQLAVGTTGGAYGAYNQSGGTALVGGFLAMGLGTGTAVFNQSGGAFSLAANGGSLTGGPATIGAGAGGVGVINLSGTATFTNAGTSGNEVWLGESGTGILNLSGSATFRHANSGLEVGKNSGATGYVNLLGGAATVKSVFNGSGTGNLNFNGGTLKPSAANATFLQGLSAAYVYAGGGTIDNNGYAITIGQALAAPANLGVSSITVSSGGAGYIDQPVVVISGGTGGGATAVANVSGGVVTGFTITSPGVYTVAPTTVTLYGGGASTAASGFTINTAANVSGGLAFKGSGTTTLSGANTYAGNTVVSNGTLLVSGSIAGPAVVGSGTLNVSGTASSTVTNNGGSLTVTGAGIVSGAVVVNPSGAIIPSTGTFGGLVTLNSGNSAINLLDSATTTTAFQNGLTLNNGNQLSFDMGSSSSDQISVSGGSFAHSGTVTINLNAIASIPSGTTYTLITDAANDIVSTSGFTVGAQPSGYTATLGTSGGALTITLTQNAPSVAYWKGNLDNKWNTVSGGVANWTSDALGTANTGVPPGTPTSVIFAAAGAANFNTVLGANFTINDLTLSTANNVTIGGATNSLTIVSGLLNDTTALNNNITISNVVLGVSQTWQNNSANPLTVSSMISGGTSALTIGGTGSTILTSTNNSYSGGTVVSSGTLQLGDGVANNGTVSGNINNNSALVFANPAALTFGGELSGLGTVNKSGNGTLTLNNTANTFSGATTISQGTLAVVTPGSATGVVNADTFGSTAVTINSGSTLFIDDSGNGASSAERDLTVANTLGGAGSMEVRAGNTHLYDTVVLNGDLSGFTGMIQV
ncbi:MAG TPA: autotransporter-associated beta strand repeat-containing protein, partial [Verrucomicrobiae bacterium]